MRERGSSEPSPGVQATAWTLVRGAAAGDAARRAEFAERYLPLVRRYLAERWRGTGSIDQLEDAAQEVFVECLREGGVLASVDPERAGGFRAFLFGAVRNVARRFEAARSDRERVGTLGPGDLEAPDRRLDDVLDHEWALCLMRQAAEHHRRIALARGAAARQGVELLRLRFEEDLPVREIAARWGEDAAVVHRRYRQAREEFRRSLRAVVAFHNPGASDLDAECKRLLDLLGGG